jgi:hypothetical protein
LIFENLTIRNKKEFIMKTLNVLLFIAILLFIGCRNKQKELQNLLEEQGDLIIPVTKGVASDLMVFGKRFTVETVGNNSYIPIESFSEVDKRRTEIMEIMQAFEKTNLGVKVIDWQIEARHSSYATDSFLYGLWIYHCPRPASEIK